PRIGGVPRPGRRPAGSEPGAPPYSGLRRGRAAARARAGSSPVKEAAVTVSRLRDIPGIGVNVVGDKADAAADPQLLRLENLDTDTRPPQAALDSTKAAVDDDDAN